LHGALTGTAPSVTYEPADNYHGPDSFTFRTNDGLLDSNIATVSLTIDSVNDAPVAQAANFNTLRTGRLVATDVDGDSLSYFLSTAPTKGSVTITSAGVFTYKPFLGKTGTDYFKFKANDGTVNSNGARVDIRIQ
jgi:Big-like domain-containing protein